MAITLAKQDGKWIRAYDGNRELWSKDVGKLHGYTSGSVNIHEGSFIRSYDEKGWNISTVSA